MAVCLHHTLQSRFVSFGFFLLSLTRVHTLERQNHMLTGVTFMTFCPHSLRMILTHFWMSLTGKM